MPVMPEVRSNNALSKGSKNKKSKNLRLGNYKPDDEFFSSSALVKNGDYILGKDTWQKIDVGYKHKSPSPLIAISNSSLSSEKDVNYSEEEKYNSSSNNWNNDDSNYVKRLLSAKRK